MLEGKVNMLTEILSKLYISHLRGDSLDKIGGDGNFLGFSPPSLVFVMAPSH